MAVYTPWSKINATQKRHRRTYGLRSVGIITNRALFNTGIDPYPKGDRSLAASKIQEQES